MAKAMPPNHSLLFIGKHGVGKSQLARQLAVHFHAMHAEKGLIAADLPVCDVARNSSGHVDNYLIDIRLSQQSEGDMIGLPELVDGVTRFCPPQWFMNACREPRLIFLDELNRATPEVMQAAFQVVLDYQLNGYKLHPETRVYAAVNPDQGNYSVNGMDAALLDRFAVVELEPSKEDWFEWALGKGPGQGDIVHQVLAFLRANEDFLDPPQATDPGSVYQSRRSWHLLSDALRYAGLTGCYEKDPLFFSLAISRVGATAATAFQDFVITMERQVTAEDVLDRWGKKVERFVEALGAERHNIIIDKLAQHCTENTWTKKQVKNVARFMETLPGEHVVGLFNKLMDSGNLPNIVGVHQLTYQLLLVHLNKQVDQEQAAAAAGS